MSTAISSRSALTITAVTVVGGLIAYAAYFDYKRRNDPSFRKKLRKEKKRVERTQPSVAIPGQSRSIDEIKAALHSLRDEQLPETAEEKEQYFMDNVQAGEQLCTQGPLFEVPAALAFYRALRVYPSPVELIMIYQKTVPEPIFKMVMEMTTLDVKQRAEGYYDSFPGASFDVSVAPVPVPETSMGGQPVIKNVLVAGKDFAAGDVIYKEKPIVAALDCDLEGKGTHCSECFRHITGPLAIRPEDDPMGSAYCSKDCQLLAAVNHHTLLFGSSSILGEASTDPSEPAPETRKAAQKKLVDFYNESGKSGIVLVARFIARIVAEETKKLAKGPSLPGAGTDYSLIDHMERLRFLEFGEEQWADQKAIVADVLKESADGLQEFVNDDRYGVMLGKFAYNAIGVTIGGGRDDKPESETRPEDREWTRTPYGTGRQLGSGLYFVSSYISHSCSPNTRPSFVDGTNEIHLIANQDIKKGEELTMAYVDVKPTASAENTTVEEQLQFRRTRRQALARGWRFACTCTRCIEEAPQIIVTSATDSTPKPAVDDVKVEGPAAQVESSTARFETGTSEAEYRTKTNSDDVE